MAKYNSDNLTKQKGLSKRAKCGISIFVISLCLFFFSVTTFVAPVHNFLIGTFGLCLYPVLVALMGVGILLMLKKRYYIAKFYLGIIIALYFVIVLFFQIILTNFNVSFGNYLSNCYNSHNTPGGVVCGVIAYIMFLGLDKIGSILLLAIALVFCVAFVIDHFLKIKEYKSLSDTVLSFPFGFSQKRKEEKANKITKTKKVVKIQKNLETTPFETNVDLKNEQKKEEKPKITLNAYQQMQENSKKNFFSNLENYQADNDAVAKQIFGEEFINSVQSENKKEEKPKSFTLNELYEEQKEQEQENNFVFAENNKPSRFVHAEETENFYGDILNHHENLNYDFENQSSQQKTQSFEENNVEELHLEDTSSQSSFKNESNNSFEDLTNKQSDEEVDFDLSEMGDIIASEDEMKNTEEDSFNTDFEENSFKNEKSTEPVPDPVFNIPKEFLKTKEKHDEQKPAERPQRRPHKPYNKPSLELLTTKSSQILADEDVFQEKALVLEETLESFRIPAKVMGITCGPAVTRYELQMPTGISVKRISQHAEDIQMRMESRGGVRIETPIPGRSLVGVEIPNAKIATIGLKDILEAPQFYESKGALTFALGKDIGGDCKVCNLETMPHLLVAGSTGSGKSVCLNVLLISLLYRLGPDELKLILIDPKRVEFVTYNYLPHMLVPKAINDAKEALNALDWVNKEMMRRYDMFSERRVRNFKEYNASEDVLNGVEDKLPYIVVVIDELADLMILAGRDLEEKIQRLTQLARAAGIHLIIATQRPSVDIITGVIKSNLPSRIAFAVTDFASSKTILDKGGAEKLLGKGDMLYAPQDLPEPIRIQCPFVGTQEVFEITEYIRQNNEAFFDESISAFISKGENTNASNSTADTSGNGGWDPLLPQALLDFIQAGGGSVSMLQRKHSIGFSRAGRIVDQMESAGFISARDPGKQTRSVLISLEKYNEIFGNDEED